VVQGVADGIRVQVVSLLACSGRLLTVKEHLRKLAAVGFVPLQCRCYQGSMHGAPSRSKDAAAALGCLSHTTEDAPVVPGCGYRTSD